MSLNLLVPAGRWHNGYKWPHVDVTHIGT